MGIAWQNLHIQVKETGRVRWERGWRANPTWDGNVTDHDLWVIWAGRGWMQTKGGRINLQPGSCLWLKPNHLYPAGQDPRNPLGVTFVHFDMVRSDSTLLADEPGLPPEVLLSPDSEMTESITRRIVELTHGFGAVNPMLEGAGDALASALFTALLMDLESESMRSDGTKLTGTRRHHRDLVMSIASRIAQTPSETPSIAALSREAGYSRDHFTRIFKAVLGRSPEAFMISNKVRAACEMLRQSKLSIKEIADMLGYRDVYFFSRQFKQQTGFNPTTFRQQSSESAAVPVAADTEA